MCNEEKPATLEYFAVKPDMRDKLHPYCRPCANRLFREKYAAAHRPYVREYNKRTHQVRVARAKIKHMPNPRDIGIQLKRDTPMPPLEASPFPDYDDVLQDSLDTFIEFEDTMSVDVGHEDEEF